MGFPGGLLVMNLLAVQKMQEIQVQSLGGEDPLEEEMAAHSSILPWRIPIDRGAWQATVHGVTKGQTRLKRLSSSSSRIHSFPGGSAGKEPTCNAGDPGLVPGSGRSAGEGIGYPLQYSCLENPMDRGVW